MSQRWRLFTLHLGLKGKRCAELRPFAKQRTGCHWASAWIWNSNAQHVDSHSRQILSPLRLNTLSISGLALSESKMAVMFVVITNGRDCVSDWWQKLLTIPVMIQPRLIVLPNRKRFFFSDLTFLCFSLVFVQLGQKLRHLVFVKLISCVRKAKEWGKKGNLSVLYQLIPAVPMKFLTKPHMAFFFFPLPSNFNPPIPHLCIPVSAASWIMRKLALGIVAVLACVAKKVSKWYRKQKGALLEIVQLKTDIGQ